MNELYIQSSAEVFRYLPQNLLSLPRHSEHEFTCTFYLKSSVFICKSAVVSPLSPHTHTEAKTKQRKDFGSPQWSHQTWHCCRLLPGVHPQLHSHEMRESVAGDTHTANTTALSGEFITPSSVHSLTDWLRWTTTTDALCFAFDLYCHVWKTSGYQHFCPQSLWFNQKVNIPLSDSVVWTTSRCPRQ